MNTRKYELVIILPGEATLAKKKSATEVVEKIIKIFKGKIEKVNDWGKHELAYKINKNTSGVFLIFELELSPEAAKALSGKLRLEEQIMRYLIIKNDVPFKK